MARIALVAFLLVMMGGFVIAQDAAAEGEGISIPPSLTTYAGLTALTVIVVGFLKRMWEKQVKGKEPMISVAVPLLLGVIAKVAHLGFADVDWSTHIVALLLSAIGAGVTHDKLINPVIKKKKPNPTG
jgi:hypothetical protein